MRRNSPLVLAIALAASAFLPTAARCGVPQTLSYQGVLTDTSGVAVTDGVHAFQFALYDVASGGIALWTESQPAVALSKGRFAVVLGSVSPLTIAFDRPYWLDVTVDGIGMPPRVPLASSPYTLGLRLPFTAEASMPNALMALRNDLGNALEIDPSFYVGAHSGGGVGFFLNDTLVGVQVFAGQAPFSSNVLTLSQGYITGGFQSADANHSGYALVRGGSAYNSFQVDGDNGGSGNPELYMAGISGTNRFVVNTNVTGDDAVWLPAHSVGPNETWGAPGIAENRVAGDVVISSTTTCQDIVTVTISTPVDGYIRVVASGQGVLYGSIGSEYITYLVDELPGGVPDPNYSRNCGMDPAPTAGGYYIPLQAERVFFKGAGTYTFRLKAKKTAGSNGEIYTPAITAEFFANSYGAVTASPALATTSTDAASASIAGTAAMQGRTAVGVQQDLRELELQAARAREIAEQAEHALVDAQARATIERMQAAVRPLHAPRSGR